MWEPKHKLQRKPRDLAVVDVSPPAVRLLLANDTFSVATALTLVPSQQHCLPGLIMAWGSRWPLKRIPSKQDTHRLQEVAKSSSRVGKGYSWGRVRSSTWGFSETRIALSLVLDSKARLPVSAPACPVDFLIGPRLARKCFSRRWFQDEAVPQYSMFSATNSLFVNVPDSHVPPSPPPGLQRKGPGGSRYAWR